LAVWTSVLAGGALLGFALLSSWLINQAKVDRLDVQIEAVLIRMGRLHGGRIPPDLATALAREWGAGNNDTVAIRLLDTNGAIVFQSDHWPQTLQPVPRRRPTAAMPEPEPPERRPPPQPRGVGQLQYPAQCRGQMAGRNHSAATGAG